MNRKDQDAAQTPPAELHVKPHPRNLPYIKALGDAIPILNAVLHTLSEVLHELRLLREPAADRTVKRIGAVGEGLGLTGEIVKRGFGAG